jgi:hypothetical protein
MGGAEMRKKTLATVPNSRKSSAAKAKIETTLKALHDLQPATRQAAQVIALLASWLGDETDCMNRSLAKC